MTTHKGVGVALLKELLKPKGREAEQRLLAQLSDEDARVFKAALPISHLPVESVDRIYAAGLPIVLPGADNPFYEFGRLQAQDNLKGMYKLFIKIATVPYVIGQTAKLWRTYNSHGTPVVDYDKARNSATMVVADHPDLPENIREVIRGYIAGTLELTGTKNTRVRREDGGKVWRWISTWE